MTVAQNTISGSSRAAIDRSVRWPVLFFFTSAAAWLAVAEIGGHAGEAAEALVRLPVRMIAVLSKPREEG